MFAFISKIVGASKSDAILTVSGNNEGVCIDTQSQTVIQLKCKRNTKNSLLKHINLNSLPAFA